MAGLRAFAAETVSEDEFEALVARAAAGERPRAYIGFEPSGTAHVGWMVCTDMVNRLVEAGFDVHILLADWHAQINDKLGGDLGAIRRCGEYMKDAFEALGVARDRVTYRWAEDFAKDKDYWALVIQVMKATTLARMRRAMTIMGRAEDEADGDMSKFLYPAMQVADIFHMGVDLAYGGMDQRHAHMLARDVAKRLGRKAPVALHTPLVPNLKGGHGRMDPLGAAKPAGATGPGATQAAADPGGAGGVPGGQAVNKMSKSDPGSGVFLHDAPNVVRDKLSKAHCPAKQKEDNPVLELVRLVIWPRLGHLHATGPPRFPVQRPEKFGGDKVYVGYEALEADFVRGALHPLDLKMAAAQALNALLAPVAAYFKAKPQNLAFVEGLRRTR